MGSLSKNLLIYSKNFKKVKESFAHYNGFLHGLPAVQMILNSLTPPTILIISLTKLLEPSDLPFKSSFKKKIKSQTSDLIQSQNCLVSKCSQNEQILLNWMRTICSLKNKSTRKSSSMFYKAICLVPNLTPL